MEGEGEAEGRREREKEREIKRGCISSLVSLPLRSRILLAQGLIPTCSCNHIFFGKGLISRNSHVKRASTHEFGRRQTFNP